MSCDDYRPDHNGECLTCDEPFDAHAPTTVGQALRDIRVSLGLTQRQLAAKLGVHWNTVARWERGELKMRRTTAFLLGYVGLVDLLTRRG